MLWRRFVNAQGLFCQSSVKWEWKLNACNIVEDEKNNRLPCKWKKAKPPASKVGRITVSTLTGTTQHRYPAIWQLKGEKETAHINIGGAKAVHSSLVMWFYKIQEESGGKKTLELGGKKIELIKEVNKVSIYKKDTQKSVTIFFYTGTK